MKIIKKDQLKPGDIAIIPKRFCIPDHRGKTVSIISAGSDYGYGRHLCLRLPDGTTLDCTTDDISPRHFLRPGGGSSNG